MRNKTGPAPKSIIDRFMAFVSPEAITGCWIWSGHISRDGYGRFGMKNFASIGYRWKSVEAHQVSYSIFIGMPPSGVSKNDDVIDRICNNRACVNPAHLHVMNRIDNILKGRK